MASFENRSWLDRAVGVCLSMLMGAAAIYIAVHLIEAVFTALLVILGVIGFIAITVAVLRARNSNW